MVFFFVQFKVFFYGSNYIVNVTEQLINIVLVGFFFCYNFHIAGFILLFFVSASVCVYLFPCQISNYSITNSCLRFVNSLQVLVSTCLAICLTASHCLSFCLSVREISNTIVSSLTQLIIKPLHCKCY